MLNVASAYNIFWNQLFFISLKRKKQIEKAFLVTESAWNQKIA